MKKLMFLSLLIPTLTLAETPCDHLPRPELESCVGNFDPVYSCSQLYAEPVGVKVAAVQINQGTFNPKVKYVHWSTLCKHPKYSKYGYNATRAKKTPDGISTAYTSIMLRINKCKIDRRCI